MAAQWPEGAGEAVEKEYGQDSGTDRVGLRQRSTPFEFMSGFGGKAASQRSIAVAKSETSDPATRGATLRVGNAPLLIPP
jgi:hypothetical protein